jgi:hypothetical protein
VMRPPTAPTAPPIAAPRAAPWPPAAAAPIAAPLATPMRPPPTIRWTGSYRLVQAHKPKISPKTKMRAIIRGLIICGSAVAGLMGSCCYEEPNHGPRSANLSDN